MPDHSDEQRLLARNVERLLSRHADLRTPGIGGYGAPSAVLWQDFAEMGLLGLPFAEDDGGVGLGLPEVAIVARALGMAAACEPYIANVVLGGGLLRALGDDAVRRALLPRLAAGRLRLCLAHSEASARFNLAHVETQATEEEGGYRLDGKKSMVLDGTGSDLILASARTSGEVRDPNGISMFCVQPDQPGVVISSYRTIDGRDAADISFEGAQADLVGVRGSAFPAIEHAVDEAIIALCAEADGAMRRMADETREYCRTRVAFGQPLSKFQAIQHKLVDMEVACEHVAAIVRIAAQEAPVSDQRRAMLASSAKAITARDSMFVAQAAVQLHGAIGTTEDLSIGRLFKRVIANATLFGGVAPHRRRYYRLRRSGKASGAIA